MKSEKVSTLKILSIFNHVVAMSSRKKFSIFFCVSGCLLQRIKVVVLPFSLIWRELKKMPKSKV